MQQVVLLAAARLQVAQVIAKDLDTGDFLRCYGLVRMSVDLLVLILDFYTDDFFGRTWQLENWTILLVLDF